MSANWQSIETLAEPTEGQSVLGAEPRQGDTYAVGEMHWTTDGWYWAWNDPTDAWGGKIYPTHWQPLPDPPVRRGAEHE